LGTTDLHEQGVTSAEAIRFMTE